MENRKEMAKAYAPEEYENSLYAKWEASGFFNPDNLPGKRPEAFSIVMPPPNVTGTLHLGHAVMLAIEDAMIRFARMRGKKTLWLPGTDHAAIATQTKVEKLILEKEGKTRQALGREEFLARVNKFAVESHDTIVNQVRKMGSSCDWSREAYTLDEPRAVAVAEAFKRLYDLGLIYRGDRVVNWCPRCASTLADDEVEYKEGTAKFYTFRYDENFPLEISTTRPETKFGDTAVAVNPGDERYKQYVGKEFSADFCGRPLKLKIVADRAVDKEFGTGALGVTPAHSVVDEKIARENDLPFVAVIGEDGRMTENAGKFAGLTVLEAREAIIKELRSRKLIFKEEEVPQNLSVCYRCSTAIEPLPKLQWWLAVNKPFAFKQSKDHPIEDVGDGEKITLKDLMIHAVKSGQIQIIPDRFVKTYFHWIENLRDWNISRQLWFGHEVPVWYRDGEIKVGESPKEKGWSRDTDTLDTWFSSGLWTFSTLGWPEETKELKTFHPTAVLETGYDILFFWIARMILMSLALRGEVPFKTVYLHGLVRDEEGRKMSKSLGNIIDPLDMIKKYGTDAVRLSLVLGTTPGNDTKLSEEKIAGFRNFTNKLWNIGRYVLTTTESGNREQRTGNKQPKPLTLPDRWIISRLAATTAEVTRHLENYELSPAGEMLRDFTWGDFADWYLEIAKVQAKAKGKVPANTEAILRYVLANILKLWHPFMPFVTEAIWAELGASKELLIVTEWPKLETTKSAVEMVGLKELVSVIRDLRANYKVEPKQKLKAYVRGIDKKTVAELPWLERLTGTTIAREVPKTVEKLAKAVSGNYEIFLDVTGGADAGRERERLEKEAANLEKYVSAIEAKLGNNEFAAKAPPVVIEKEKGKLVTAREELKKIRDQLELVQ